MKWIILIAFVFIIGSLASAGFYLVRDRGTTRNVARALTVRISLSVALFLLLMLAYALGWIEPHGITVVAR